MKIATFASTAALFALTSLPFGAKAATPSLRSHLDDVDDAEVYFQVRQEMSLGFYFCCPKH
jgi:hypothetical protein